MYHILICDDERDIVSALKIYLDSPDYSLHTAENGMQAVELCREMTMHLVLMDIMMPVMDGIRAMQEIREFSNVPIILLTAGPRKICASPVCTAWKCSAAGSYPGDRRDPAG